VNKVEEFFAEVEANVRAQGKDTALRDLGITFMRETCRHKYSYNFTWLGRPIIQFPQDIVAMQEIIWRVRPDLIIETGIAHGGGLIFYASILELIGERGEVLGIDIDIREHNRVEIEKHPMCKRLKMIQGSSVDDAVVAQVREIAKGKRAILVALDSNHCHAHVLCELQLYSPLVTRGSYLVVFDTGIEELPEDFFPDRPWGKGNNPKTAVAEFVRGNDRFVVDKEIEDKLLITVARGGYLRCIRD
jgi:cephalosporin hydroxylase